MRATIIQQAERRVEDHQYVPHMRSRGAEKQELVEDLALAALDNSTLPMQHTRGNMELNNKKVMLIPESQISSAGMVLTEAFFDDPLNQYVFPDPEERRRVLPWYFAASVREGALFQSVYSIGEPIKGVAVWTPPGFQERTEDRAKQSGLDQMSRQFGSEAYQRFTSILSYLSCFSSQALLPAHWYLSLIGVAPSCQGQGIGGALLAPVLQQADHEGMMCSLETFEENNLSFYSHHGFQVVATAIEPHSQLRFWTMRRSPRTSF
jgi:ribosomal protein S18 acetylase RimI-like enzyme